MSFDSIKKGDRLMLAFGANTQHDHMRHRCPGAKFIGVVDLFNHALVFRGVADVIRRQGSKVECALWTITQSDEAALDRFEGVPHMYRKMYATLTINGVQHRALYYQMTGARRDQHEPPQSYEQCLRDGYEHCGMDPKQIDLAIREAKRSEHREKRYRGKWVRIDEQAKREAESDTDFGDPIQPRKSGNGSSGKPTSYTPEWQRETVRLGPTLQQNLFAHYAERVSPWRKAK
jgi:gamma-glutamylcyclotransferase (GGCT)/AIG2-like uncharacterized protein YtfP